MANKPDIVVVDKERRMAVVIDVAIMSDSNTKKKEHKKLEKYQRLREELEKMLRVKEWLNTFCNIVWTKEHLSVLLLGLYHSMSCPCHGSLTGLKCRTQKFTIKGAFICKVITRSCKE